MSTRSTEKKSDPCPCPACGKTLTSRKAVPKHTNGCPEWDKKFPDTSPSAFNFDAFYKTGFWQEGFEEGIDYVNCKICLAQGIDYRKTRILHHVKSEHSLTKAQYLTLYPEALTSCSSTNKKRVATVQDRFGVDNVFQAEEIKDKFDVRETSWNPEAREKRAKTNQERYGHENPLGGEGGQHRAVEGMLKVYGEPNPALVPEIQEQKRETNYERFGDWYVRTEDFKEKAKETCLERYGVPHFMRSAEAMVRVRRGLRSKYGVDSPMRNPASLQKMLQNRTYDSPNKLEQEVDSWSERLYFTGDGKILFHSDTFGRAKNPDFIVLPEDEDDSDTFLIDRCVEVFGDYWHGPEITGMSKEAHVAETLALYEDLGVSVLILWECDIRNDPEGCQLKLNEFLE